MSLELITREERLNQPRVTRLEMLKQFRDTGPLSPSAEKEYQELSGGSASGPKKTES